MPRPLIVWLLGVLSAAGQSLDQVEWQQTFGGTNRDTIRCSKQLPNNGYVFGGYSMSPPSGNKFSPNYGGNDFWIIRSGSKGEYQWDRTYGGTNDERVFALCLTSDGGCAVAGASASPSSGNKTSPAYGSYDYWIVRLDTNGTKVWEAAFGGSGVDIASTIQPTHDGGFVVGGWSYSPADGNKAVTNFGGADVWLLRLDPNGNKLWETNYGGTGDETNVVLEVLPDHSIIFGATTYSGASGNKTNAGAGGWVVRLDEFGNKLWEQNVFYIWTDYPTIGCIHQQSNGEFIIGGAVFAMLHIDPAMFYYIARLDDTGNLLWQKENMWYGDFYDNAMVNIVSAPAGGFFMGLRLSYDLYNVFRLDTNYNWLWVQSYGVSSSGQNFYTMEPTSDGGVILGGESGAGIGGNKTSTNYGGWDGWVVKLVDRYILHSQVLVAGRGTVHYDPPPGPDGRYALGSVVQITAVPNPGFVFDSWTGDVSGSNTITNLTMIGNHSVTARFVPDTPTPPMICASSTGLVLQATNRGSVSATIQVWNGGGGTLSFFATSSVPWMSIAYYGGVSFVEKVNVSITLNASILSNGVYNTAVHISSTNNEVAPITVPVTFVVNTLIPLDNWSVLFTNIKYNYLWSFDVTSDGGFVLGGYSDVYPSYSSASLGDLWVVRLDAAGNYLWDRSFGGPGKERMSTVRQTSDGGYILGAWSTSSVTSNKTSVNFGGADYWIVRLDSNGNRLWDRSYGGTNDDYLTCLRITPDGGFMVGGYSKSPPSGNKTSPSYGMNDYWLLRLDASGNKLWEKTFGGTNEDWLNDLTETKDGGFLLGGGSMSLPSGNKGSTNFGYGDFWVVRLDANGNELWEAAYGGGGDDVLRSLQQTADGGFVLAGHTESAMMWLVRLGPDGQKLWDHKYTVPWRKMDANAVLEAVGGGFLLAGYCEGAGMAIRVDENGNELWERAIGMYESAFTCLAQMGDGGFLIGGHLLDINGDISRYYLLKLSPEWPWLKTIPQPGQEFSFRLMASVIGAYVVERSTNLLTWLPWETNNFTGERTVFTDPETLQGHRGFYRVIRLPSQK